MRLVSYKREGAAPRAGMLVDGDVVDLEESGRAIGVELGADLLAILRQEQAGVDALRAVAAESHRLPRVPQGRCSLARLCQSAEDSVAGRQLSIAHHRERRTAS